MARDGPAVSEAFTTACINCCSHVAIAGRSHTLDYVYIYICIPQVDADIHTHLCIDIYTYIFMYVYYIGVCDTTLGEITFQTMKKCLDFNVFVESCERLPNLSDCFYMGGIAPVILH